AVDFPANLISRSDAVLQLAPAGVDLFAANPQHNMRAAVYLGKEQLIVQDVPTPTLDDGEMLLQIHACSVCGTDLRTYRHGDKKIIPPRILGHEFSATVAESRAPDANVKVGDRVVMYIVLVHERDRYVEMGRENLTAHRTTMSYHHDGAFAP